VLFDKASPYNPVNRRIDIVVLTKKAQQAIEGEQGVEPVKAEQLPKEPVDPIKLPADKQPMPMHEERQKLNLFDDKAP
jgi:chemotaxis protein MotB